MGKSSASCLRIIACGSDSVDEDRRTLPASKSSSNRCGWSFRKRSAGRSVLSNTVVSEVPLFINKNRESSAANSQVQPNLTFPEKTSIHQMTQEDNELPAKIESSSSEIFSVEDDCRADVTIDESNIIIIQTAIRGYLAQQVLLKQKHAIKLQAAVRGHLVRRHAVGTLRCIQAIIKMQTLVRQRRTWVLDKGSGTSKKQNGDSAKTTLKPVILSSRGAVEPNVKCTYTSVEKLLSNKFARQLMESTPKTQPINIKCEPLKSDSAWKWLVRWMAVSSTVNDEPHESGSAGQKHRKEDSEYSEGKGSILLQSGFNSELKDFKPTMRPSDEASESNDMITYDSDNFVLPAHSSVSPSSSHPKLENIDELDSGYNITQLEPTDGKKETVLISEVETESPPYKEDAGNKQSINDAGQFFAEQHETDAKNFPMKASNPTSVITPSKHEGLSSASTSSTLNTLLSDNPGVQSSFNSVSTSPPFSSREIGPVDASVSSYSAIQVATSECGTELSISSTLDSPDRLENGSNALEQESKMFDVIDHPGSRGSLPLEANDNSHILGTELSYPNINELEGYEGVDSVPGECNNYVPAVDSSQLEKKPESDQTNFIGDLESDVYKPSPEASQRSCTTVTESQATPSGQMSVKPEKSTGEKRETEHKRKRFISTTTPNRNSPSRSLEQLLKEHKTGKRRNSLGSAKPNHTRKELRDTSSNDSLPSYMQATEAARAKAISNGSPRSSLGVQDKDIHVKNQGSLPGTNVRQGSPLVHRSLLLAQNTKGTGVHSPQERKWRL